MDEKQDLDLEQRYRAPALDKGLDILELLATTAEPQTVTSIVKRLGRSTGEMFRMIQVLEYRGYIERAMDGDGYQLTSKLFGLMMIQPPVQSLVEVALPRMRDLARVTGQSCHLAMHSRGDIVIVARMESNAEMGFSVRVGYRRSLISTTSGLLLYAFQDSKTREQWEQFFVDVDIEELMSYRKRADSVREIGHVQMASTYVSAVTDISSPIIRGSRAAAALTVPFVYMQEPRMSLEETLVELSRATDLISEELHVGDDVI